MTKADGISKAASATGGSGKMEVVSPANSAGNGRREKDEDDEYAGNNDDDDDDDQMEQDDVEGDGDADGDDHGDGQAKTARLMRACDNCRRKKVKCNGTKPSCSHCTRMKLGCHYSPLVRKKRVRRSIIDKLEERLESMEQMLQPLVERLSPNDPVVSTGIGGFGLGFGFAPAPMPAIAHPLGMGLPGVPAAASGYGYGYSAGTSQPPYSPPGGVSQGIPKELTFQPSLPSTGPALPPLPIIEELMEIATARATPSAPAVSWPRMMRRLHSGQLPEFIVCANIALGARFSNRPEFSCTPRYNAGREYAKRAAELISGLVDRPDPDVVLCMVMLSLYEWGCGRGESAWSYTGMATRLAQRCRLHLVDEEDFNENVDEQPHSWASTEWRRRLWWHVYCGDRTSVIVASRPATVHDDDCVVNLPTHDHEWIMGTVPGDESDPQVGPKQPDCWWMIVELYRTCSRISEFVNRRRRPVRKGEIPRRTMFEILDNELEDVRSRFVPGMEFPPSSDWAFNSYASLTSGTNCTGNIRAIYFNAHLMYYAAKIILYRSELPNYLHESIVPELIEHAKNVCIDAAHKQADVIRWALDTIPVEDWDPKVGVWSLQGASIHVNAALSDDNATAEQSRRDLEVHLKLHVASDQYYHFNMAIITMLHHVFNLRKKQRLALGNTSTAIVAARGPNSIVIDHENDIDPWIVPRCSSFLGFTYNYAQLRGVLNEAIKQTTYSPPDAITSEGDYSNNTDQQQQQQQQLQLQIQQQQQQQQQHGMHSYHMSIGNTMMSAGAGIPSPIPQIDHRRMSADTAAGTYAVGNFDMSGRLWQPPVASPTAAVPPAVGSTSMAPPPGGLDRTASLPASMSGNPMAVVQEDIPLQQQINIGLGSPLTPTGEESAAQPKSIKRSFSSSVEKAPKGKGSGGRGRKPASNTTTNASQSPSAAASAGIPHKAAGTQQLEKLQRLEELRARVVLLQQLSGQTGGSVPGNTANTVNASAAGISSAINLPMHPSLQPSSVAAMSASAGNPAGSKDVNGFLNNFAASIGSVASQLGSLPETKSMAAPAQPANYSASSASSTSPPQMAQQRPQQQQQQQQQQQFHADPNAWLANTLSQQNGLNAPGTMHSFVLPDSSGMGQSTAPFTSAATDVASESLGYLQGFSSEDIRLIMSQHMDPSGGGMGYGDAGMHFSGDLQPPLSMAQDYSTADIQGLMQRLTTFNSGAAEDGSGPAQH
ncbi:hypothetical protein GGF39_003394 [Coemansia sp. RSA 1721]|nr:hypothetical protein GGF39_003394 [Coemansia sp. RSA 1721]